jgi:peptidoglycan/xylan/chitin deacetylase (PgdA/CDA1 family)
LLAAQPVDVQQEELRASKTWLESFLGRPVRSFSYPYGGSHHFTPNTVDAAREAGFDRACTTIPRYVRGGDGPYELGRIQVPDVNGEQFENFLFNFRG